MKDPIDAIRSYVRDENPIWDLDSFNQMLELWANDKEITLYRGINFRNKDAYDNFLNKLEEQNGYFQGSASSFSDDFLTAEGFAKCSKSYFLDKEVMRANAVQNTLGERITGYRGVILEVTVPPGSVVDVQKSGEAIENEYLIRPSEVIKVKVHELKTFYDLTQEEGFDVNKALENEILKQQKEKNPIIQSSFARYLIINHIDEIAEDLKTTICQNDLSLELKRRRELDLNDVEDDYKSVLVHKPEVSITRNKGYSFREKVPDEIKIQPVDFSYYEELDLITSDIKKSLRKIASEALQSAMEIHLEYRDDVNVDIQYDGLNRIYNYLSKEEQSLHTRMIGYGVKDKYDALNKKVGENFNMKNAHSAAKEIGKFLTKIIEASPVKKEKAKKRQEERRRQIEEAKQYRMEILGILPKNENTRKFGM